jgi:hypothetical protein
MRLLNGQMMALQPRLWPPERLLGITPRSHALPPDHPRGPGRGSPLPLPLPGPSGRDLGRTGAVRRPPYRAMRESFYAPKALLEPPSKYLPRSGAPPSGPAIPWAGAKVANFLVTLCASPHFPDTPILGRVDGSAQEQCRRRALQ